MCLSLDVGTTYTPVVMSWQLNLCTTRLRVNTSPAKREGLGANYESRAIPIVHSTVNGNEALVR